MNRRTFVTSLFAAALAPAAVMRAIAAPPTPLTGVLICYGGAGFGGPCHLWSGNPAWEMYDLLAFRSTPQPS